MSATRFSVAALYERRLRPLGGHRPPLQSRAFTLIEVLVALAVLALAAIVLGAAYANTLEAHRAVAQRAVGGSAMDFLHDQVLNEPEREKVEKGGDVSLPDDRRLRWEAKIEEAPVPDLFKVTVTTRTSGGTMKADEESTETLMLLRPTWSDAQRREQLRSDWRAAHEKAQEARK
ncbi:MAG: prepilin-type N-terminal cleavage/methylation domain-containing protein [Opitutae bacterium]|nr:prepilin-type N-terminal cleavage/methylation domain-containing protein [Opitutae bacterium]